MTRIWVKLFLEILHDPKMNRLPNHLWRRAIELILLAGETGDDGALPTVEDMAWILRLEIDKMLEDLQGLAEVGVAHEAEPGKWVVVNFKKRQYSESYERMKRYRARNSYGNGSVTSDENCSSSLNSPSSSLSSEEGGVGGETQTPVEAEFVSHFGLFNSPGERKRWEALIESVGFEKAQGIAAWAERQEIHMVNRGRLMDSLETAAKNDFGKKNQSKSFQDQLAEA